MSSTPENIDTPLTRKELSRRLKEAGYPIEPTTLATKASRGGGPPFRRWGRTPLYQWGSSLAWAQERLSPPRCSSAEADPQGLPQPLNKQTPPCPRGTPKAPPSPSGDDLERISRNGGGAS